MDNRPIGFFDSGLGGLTTIPYLAQLLPEEKRALYARTAAFAAKRIYYKKTGKRPNERLRGFIR